MTKEQKILEILNSKPTQKIGLDDFYGRQTVTNMLKEAINYTQCCEELKAEQECYKSGQPCKFDCSGLCKESC